jgi:hypothetical protein
MPGRVARTRQNRPARLDVAPRIMWKRRGSGESGWWPGPTVSVAQDEHDVDRYVELFEELLAELTTV